MCVFSQVMYIQSFSLMKRLATSKANLHTCHAVAMRCSNFCSMISSRIIKFYTPCKTYELLIIITNLQNIHSQDVNLLADATVVRMWLALYTY